MVKLNIGCGNNQFLGWVNLDISPDVHPEVVHDLDIGPWPFENESATQIVAKDVFEHVMNPILFMTECHRILKSYATVEIQTTHWECPDAYTDPTHRRFPTEHTFDYWIEGAYLHQEHNLAYGGVTYRRLDHYMNGGEQVFVLRKV